MKKAVKKSRRELKKRIKQLEALRQASPVIIERPEVVTLRAKRTFSEAFERWRPPKEIVVQDLVQSFGSAVWKNGLFTATETERPDRTEYVVECQVLRPTKGQEHGMETDSVSKALARSGALFNESALALQALGDAARNALAKEEAEENE